MGQLSTTPPGPVDYLSPGDFSRLSNLIYTECGIKMPDAKKPMLEARLSKRLKALKFVSFKAYCEFLFSPQGMGDEFVSMIDVVTTNKTDFFREPHHFTYLYDVALPSLLRQRGVGTLGRLSAWSAGCSTGEEPYTLAMVLGEFAKGHPGYRFSILGTDISTRALEKAKGAVYDEERAEPVPLELKKEYLLKSRNRERKLIKICPELRSLVHFTRLNLMDDDYGMGELFHLIFCRNVIIYFDRVTQERLLKKLCRLLAPDGYMFMGHSETLNGMALPLAQCALTVYRKVQ